METGQLACMQATRNANKILVGKTKGGQDHAVDLDANVTITLIRILKNGK